MTPVHESKRDDVAGYRISDPGLWKWPFWPVTVLILAVPAVNIPLALEGRAFVPAAVCLLGVFVWLFLAQHLYRARLLRLHNHKDA